MNYPVWELELGGGLLIAIVAILHVYVSHFAIGGGLFLVVTEHYAYRRNDEGLLRYLVTHSRFFILITLVFGAVSGVGIWFTIGLISPAATSALIHIFVWGWAIEWVFFFVEIAAAIIYYQTWNRVPRRTHLAIGWVYFVSAFMSLVVINGIVAFMLTPGDWLSTRSFWDGFFNPTYWPSLAVRTAICVALAGVYALLTGTFVKEKDTRKRLVRYAGVWAAAGTLLAIPAVWWYHQLLPGGAEELFAGGQPAAAMAAQILGWVGLGLFVISLVPIAAPRAFGKPLAVVICLAALFAFGAGEWVREAVRKPYVIHSYMYSTGLRSDETSQIAESGGILAHAKWTETEVAAPDAAVGEDVFRVVCRSCHTLDGYNGLRVPLQGLDEEFVYELTGRLEVLRGQMPPFPGTDVERKALARYLSAQAGEKTWTDGRDVFEKRCGFCHMKEGFQPLYDSLQGYTREDVIDVLPLLGDMTDEMAPWTGTDEEADLLAGYILSWYATDTNTVGGEH
jgi:mono/diheme cytochrome c family protein